MSARNQGVTAIQQGEHASAIAYRNRLGGEGQPNIFCGLSKAQSEQILAGASLRHTARGKTIFAQGAKHEGIFLIKNGLIRTFHTSPAGCEITLAYWQAGNIVGTPQVFGSGKHMWSGVTAQDSEIYAFRGDKLRELMMAIPQFAIAMIGALEFKGKYLSALLQMLGTRSVSERLAILLINLAEIHGTNVEDGIAVGPPFTHEVFSQMIGASRQWVTMTLDCFQREGLIRINRCKIVILDFDRLRGRPAALNRKPKLQGRKIATESALFLNFPPRSKRNAPHF